MNFHYMDLKFTDYKGQKKLGIYFQKQKELKDDIIATYLPDKITYKYGNDKSIPRIKEIITKNQFNEIGNVLCRYYVNDEEIKDLEVDGKVYKVFVKRDGKRKSLSLNFINNQFVVRTANGTYNSQINEALKNSRDIIIDTIRKSNISLNSSVLTIEELEEKIDGYIKKHQASIGIPKYFVIKDLKSAWGICHSSKWISFSSNMTMLSDEQIEYVVVHELCHLKFMNHSKDFWNEVYLHCPDYENIRFTLKNFCF